ncbi:uncharacterized protein B0H64DRAFT_157830 [Chaetomium fimeti]|uniref:Uncharacterized protein n=1 Tax=Chaetomium fimeti TaxID=1854472 RepID=A0AAE0HHN2_9PEZI|nr:hypothetical protein B0H64DRAFT_157830 [Chaetomium fimeti]
MSVVIELFLLGSGASCWFLLQGSIGADTELRGRHLKCSLAFMHPLSFGGRSEVFGNRKAGPSRHDIILQQIEHGENSSELYTLMPFVVMTPPEMPAINANKGQVQPQTGERVGFPIVSAQHTINITHLVGLAWAGLVLIRPYPQARRG